LINFEVCFGSFPFATYYLHIILKLNDDQLVFTQF